MSKLSTRFFTGQLTNFPPKIVELMIKEQVAQGNEANVEVFQKYKFTSKSLGGFNWGESVDGEEFWNDILVKLEFDKFYSKYA